MQLTDATVIVTGASRGLGRAIARSFHDQGATVVGVATSASRLAVVGDELGPRFVPITADVADPMLVERLLDDHKPDIVVLNAGAATVNRPIQGQTWETLSRHWNVDVRQTFEWVRAALTRPLAAGSTVLTLSSGAAIGGSPLSGGYAGAKATVRFLTQYAADESERAELGIRFLSILPKLTPSTDLGAAAVAAYADRIGRTIPEYLDVLGPSLAADDVGRAITDLAAGDEPSGAFLLGADGPRRLP